MKDKVLFSLSSLLLIVSIFFLCTDVVSAKDNCFLLNNNSICISEEEYNNLLNLGFDDFEINNMSSDVYDSNKNVIGTVVSDTVNYYINTYTYSLGKLKTTSTLVSEEEYNNFVPLKINNRGYSEGYVETSAKKMRTKIIQISNHFRYKNTLDWKYNPSVRSYDIIGIGLDSSVVSYSNIIFQQTYCVTNANCTYSTTGDVYNPITGVGVSFPLPKGTYVKMQSYLYYDVYKRDTNVNTKTLNAYGDYSHAIQTVTQSQAMYGYNINTFGLVLYSTIYSKYDEIPEAEAQWIGTW